MWCFHTKQDLAKVLLEMFTANKMAKAFFTSGGSDANDTQVSITILQTLISYFLSFRPIRVVYEFPVYIMQVKLVWYYNNALGRPEKKKFIARKKSWVMIFACPFPFVCFYKISECLQMQCYHFRYHGSTLISASLSG